MRYFCLALAAICCGCGSDTGSLEDLQTRMVKLPNGREIRAEVMMKALDMQRGMMYRDALPPDRGMLFVHSQPGLYAYWMYNVKIPLDIVWLDSNHRIVEISADTPPCQTRASECPNYGGKQMSHYVLELAGGQAVRQGLRVGDNLGF